jgi:N,N'-diacetyllegionaminate synthase
MVEIIAEIANAHQGNVFTALKLAKAAKAAGADAVKFQIYFAEDFISKGHSRYNHFKNQSFSKIQWKKIIKETKKIGIKIYCDVLGEQAFKLAESLKIDGYKIHSSDVSNKKLLNKISKQNKKVFLSCGGAKLTEIYYALNILLKKKKKIILLHGFQSYPTKIEDTDLNRIKKLKKEFGNKVEYGFQDHISGEDKYNLYVCLVALGYGVTYFEKHITFNRGKKGVDYYSSLETKELRNFIKTIKNTQKSLSNSKNDFSEKEYDYRKTTKKMLILNKFKKKGQYISEADVEYKRAETNCHEPLDIDYLKDRKLILDLRKNTILKKNYFLNKIIIVVVARSKSKRLPGKALLKITDKSMIEHLLLRLKKTNKENKILLCTTKEISDDKIEKLGKKCSIDVFRGPVNNVLERVIKGIKKYNHNIVVRVTGDDILIDLDYMNLAINYLLENNLDYVDHKGLPSGTETEIFDRKTLELIFKTGNDLEGTEYLTNYIKNNKLYFKCGSAPVFLKHRSNLRLTIDYEADYKYVKKFLLKMRDIKKEYNYNMDDIIKFYSKLKSNKIINNKIKKELKYDTSLNLNNI